MKNPELPETTVDAGTPKPPRTEAQRDASRKNGANSLGPITPSGKIRSSKNAIRHGLTATEHTLLMAEDPAQYKEVVDAFIDKLRPADKAELRLVEKIANLDWRLERLVMLETCLLNMAVGVNSRKILDRYSAIDGIGCVVAAWMETNPSTTQCLDLLRRYMGTLQHQFNTTLSNYYKFETRRLAQKRDRDLDPEFQPPYHPPIYEVLDPQPDLEAGIRNEPEPHFDHQQLEAPGVHDEPQILRPAA